MIKLEIKELLRVFQKCFGKVHKLHIVTNLKNNWTFDTLRSFLGITFYNLSYLKDLLSFR